MPFVITDEDYLVDAMQELILVVLLDYRQREESSVPLDVFHGNHEAVFLTGLLAILLRSIVLYHPSVLVREVGPV